MTVELRSDLRAERDAPARAPASGLSAPAVHAPQTSEEEKELQRAVPMAGRDRRPKRAQRRAISKLTLRVLAVNMAAPILLVSGMLYLPRYEERLIRNEFDSLRIEAQIFAGALAEAAGVGGVDTPVIGLDSDLARQMVRRLYETTDTRTRLFGTNGNLLADSRIVGQPGGIVEIEPLLPPSESGWFRLVFDQIYDWVTRSLAQQKTWPAYVERQPQTADDYASVQAALAGGVGRQIWRTDGGGEIFGVAVPVQRLRGVLGAVLVTRDSAKLAADIQSVREDVLRIFILTLAITVLVSLYLASTITRPIRRLAEVALSLQRGHGRRIEIPDFTRRKDEIGDLSGALRSMTDALFARMDAIERFAADVSHEIKNPLTSLRSAVETAARIKDPAQQKRLMAIIQEDVQRLDRLITDISDASRLDAELSRAELETVDIGRMLAMLVDLYRTTVEETEGAPVFTLEVPKGGRIGVLGLEGRLVQVFRNLIGNAITFSPPGGTIALKARRSGKMVEVTIEDEGPGIPESKLDAIFERFYSERPAGEQFGKHSGLGLSISRQIVTAHRGEIFAENRSDRTGARFTVRLPAR